MIVCSGSVSSYCSDSLHDVTLNNYVGMSLDVKKKNSLPPVKKKSNKYLISITMPTIGNCCWFGASVTFRARA